MLVQETNGILTDYHLHTEHSHCCEDITTDRIREAAPQWPFTIAITDHSAHIHFEPQMRGRFDSDDAPEVTAACMVGARDRVRRYLDKVRSLGSERILAGTELDILPDGRPVFPEEMLAELDIIVGAVHALAAIRHQGTTEEVLSEWREQNRALIRLGSHIIAHPFRYLTQRRVPIEAEDVRWIVATAAEAGVALELNQHYRIPELDVQMVRECRAQGVRIAIGTDSHRWSEIGDTSYHREILTACGVDEAQYGEALYVHQR